MTSKAIRLNIGSIFPKGPGKIYFYRYQVDGHRKTVSLQTANRAEALRKAEEFIPIIKGEVLTVAGLYFSEYVIYSCKMYFRIDGIQETVSGKCGSVIRSFPKGGDKFNSDSRRKLMEILIAVTAVIVIILFLIGFFFSVLYDVLAAVGHTFMAVIRILDKIIDFGRRCMKFIRSKEQ